MGLILIFILDFLPVTLIFSGNSYFPRATVTLKPKISKGRFTAQKITKWGKQGTKSHLLDELRRFRAKKKIAAKTKRIFLNFRPLEATTCLNFYP